MTKDGRIALRIGGEELARLDAAAAWLSLTRAACVRRAAADLVRRTLKPVTARGGRKRRAP